MAYKRIRAQISLIHQKCKGKMQGKMKRQNEKENIAYLHGKQAIGRIV
ncbi:MAG: hypothetical protein OXT03_03275 [Alphaproteobacteria bacterium]|nr:hypothetical protein [Alphaproteobacteria bacterium]